ncbi:ankyrin repeat and protein kinase domain-containing protein 1-like isoform X2 [Cheilinus undulatus]|uniref:ankyrin repeat and protein kinase domain-containing protein 1-like isoform X2 n=1 Tax=Cheilinus undulatus TaxID=241271 RepID=UPI001BD573D2|nr:ankyrin repeat and protein kinase domain-containing protein 1-like isoform X2 [Cheilinus undulatus]
MMALLSQTTVGNENLEKWVLVGQGGFGNVFKARHKDLGFDVAIKILRDGVCSFLPEERALFEEAAHMEKASCEYVLRFHGFYQGCPPCFRSPLQQKGIVMDFMERGSVQSLLEDPCSPLPWPLVFRLIHQVALGMNFLHTRRLMHHDLKPSNVLLTGDLNAKLADFGLCRVSASASHENRDTTKKLGGSYKYMPPEAFETSYQPVRAFDIYSYGILLWSILTGKEPYPVADHALVALKIPLGDRPPWQDIDQQKAEGLKELVDLMRKCWDQDPSKRPTFKECLKITEYVFLKHKTGVHGAVNQVLTRLESPTRNQHQNSFCLLSTPDQPKLDDSVDGSSSKQDSVSVPTKIQSTADKANFIDEHRAELIQVVSEVMAIIEELGDMVHGEAYSEIKALLTNTRKMRELYDRTLRSGGVKVKAAFFDALKKHHPGIVERLGG